MPKNSKNRSNGHGAANGADVASPGRGRAASVDARGPSVANASVSSAEAGADHEAYAEAAHAPNGELKRAADKKREPTKQAGSSGNTLPRQEDPEKIAGATKPLPRDGEAFVRAVHRQLDLVALETKLLSSKDEKVAQRELACLRELRYGKRAPVAEEDLRPMIYDAPRPEREIP